LLHPPIIRSIVALAILYLSLTNAVFSQNTQDGPSLPETIDYLIKNINGNSSTYSFERAHLIIETYACRRQTNPDGLIVDMTRSAGGIVHRETTLVAYGKILPSDITIRQWENTVNGNVWMLAVPVRNASTLGILFENSERANRVAKAFVHIAGLYGAKPDPFR
jgi:hypothetical protein